MSRTIDPVRRRRRRSKRLWTETGDRGLSSTRRIARRRCPRQWRGCPRDRTTRLPSRGCARGRSLHPLAGRPAAVGLLAPYLLWLLLFANFPLDIVTDLSLLVK